MAESWNLDVPGVAVFHRLATPCFDGLRRKRDQRQPSDALTIYDCWESARSLMRAAKANAEASDG